MLKDSLRLVAALPRYSVHIWRTRRFEIIFVAMASLCLFLSYVFLELASEISEGETLKVDEQILLALRRPDDLAQPIGPRWLKGGMLDATALGSPLTLGIFSAAMIGLLFMEGQRRVAWLSAMAIGGGVCCASVLKLIFARPRPTIVPHLREVTNMSFPSGHAMISAVVYLTIGVMFAKAVRGYWAKAYCLFWGVVLTVIVGVSRVYLGVHYPSDVLGGWIAGLSWASACWIVARFVPARQLTTAPPQ